VFKNKENILVPIARQARNLLLTYQYWPHCFPWYRL